MRAVHAERNAPFACAADANDNGLGHLARHGQNERTIALTRKNALFAGHDIGAENWAIAASLIETCKLNFVDPLAWMTDTLTKLVNLWPASRIIELMPWEYPRIKTADNPSRQS